MYNDNSETLSSVIIYIITNSDLKFQNHTTFELNENFSVFIFFENYNIYVYRIIIYFYLLFFLTAQYQRVIMNGVPALTLKQ